MKLTMKIEGSENRKEIRLLAGSQIFAFPLKSVSVAAKVIIGRQKHANQGTHRVKLLTEEDCPSQTILDVYKEESQTGPQVMSSPQRMG